MEPKSSARTKQSDIDYINIGLMIASVLLAIKLPFTLFLLAYAILGPLHYLTEIFWLNKNQYYVTDRKDIGWLLILGIIVTVVFFAGSSPLSNYSTLLKTYYFNIFSGLIFISLIASIAFTLFTEKKHKIITILIGVLLTIFFWKWPTYLLLFGILLTSIIHVCVFTAAFILYGALKAKQFSSYFSFFIYLLCIVAFFVFPLNVNDYTLPANQYNSLKAGSFDHLNYSLAQVLRLPAGKTYDLLSENAIRIQCFIAFAYTYHYLNWFSKVDIIKWNKIPRNIWTFTIITWIAAVALYFFNYKMGLMALFLLSLLHVFLEFPLNVKTFISIGKAITKTGNK